MSNSEAVYGLKPVRTINGSPYNGSVIPCYIAASYATALFVGDPVTKSDEADDMDATGKRFSVEKATVTDGGIIFGVIVGFNELQTDLSKQYNPASTERIAYVCPADGIVFKIAGCGGGTPTDIFPGQNAEMIAGTGSTVFGTSGVKLDEGTTTAPSADLSNPLYILNVVNREDNELADFAEWEVLINTPFDATGRTIGIAAS